MKSLLATLGMSLCVFILSAQELTESHLPIVIINYENDVDEIPDEPKALASMSIIDNGLGNINLIGDSPNAYAGNIGIETRGNSTQGFYKKTYSIELWDEMLQDQSLPLLGMGTEEDWILHAMVIDKTQFRIPLSFDLARAMGHYAANYRFVELVINDEYRGLYILTEKIKRDNDRVDISKLNETDINGDEVTGGYILRIDWIYDLEEGGGFESNYESQSGDPMTYQYYYPKAASILPEQKAYIQNWMNTFEDAVFSSDYTANGTRYTDLIDVTSFTDFLIINELSKNADGYKLSSYMHKDRVDVDDRLHAGPIWDFDQTYGMSEVCSNFDPLGWTYQQNQNWCEDLESMPMFWQAMMADTIFTNHLACRWNTLRQGPLHQDSIFQRIDVMDGFVGVAMDRNFERWDFQGENIWIEPDPLPFATHEEEVDYMKNWIQQRLVWLDQNMPGTCVNDVISNVEQAQDIVFLNVFPNPTQGTLNVWSEPGNVLTVFNVQGQVLTSKQLQSTAETIDLTPFPKGLYLVQSTNESQSKVLRVVLE